MVSKRDERHEQDGETLHGAKEFRDLSASGDPAMALVPFGIGQTICPVMSPTAPCLRASDSGGLCRPLTRHAERFRVRTCNACDDARPMTRAAASKR